MIISSDSGKAFNKILHQSINDKNCWKAGNKGKLLQPYKEYLQKPYS